MHRIFAKIRFFCRRQFGSNDNRYHFDVVDPKITYFGEITQNNGHYAIQGHSRLPIWLPDIDSPYAIFY